MKLRRLTSLLIASLSAWSVARAADKLTVTVTNDAGLARPAETIAIPFDDVKARLAGIVFDQVLVRDASGAIVPAQITAYKHVHKGPPHYDDLVFQHDFAAGETTATFTVEKSATPVPPFPSKVYARPVPERYDDFAWENDRIGHRIYGAGLELPSATKDQMISSGIDIWSKKVRYSIIDHWYHKGHDGLHTDTGEGLDMYDVGTSRGSGGTGIWDGTDLHVSKNWRTWLVDANGPIRAVFDLGYEAWDAGHGVMVTETKRFIVDAGHNLDEIQSTFNFTPAPGSDGTLTVAVGLTEHQATASVASAQDEKGRAITIWEEYKSPVDGKLGTGVILAPDAAFAGFAETKAPANARGFRPDLLVLAKVKPGETVSYYAGGGWDKSGDFPDKASWDTYMAGWAKRLASPVKVTLSAP